MRFPEDVPTLTDGVVTLRAHRADDVPALRAGLRPAHRSRGRRCRCLPPSDARGVRDPDHPGGWETGSRLGVRGRGGRRAGTPRFAGTVALRDEGDRRAEIAYGAHPWVARTRRDGARLRLLLDWGFERAAPRDGDLVGQPGQLGLAPAGLAARLLLRRHRCAAGCRSAASCLDAWVGMLLAGDPREPRSPWFDAPRIDGRSVVAAAATATDDVPRIVEACRDEETAHWLGRLPQPYTRTMPTATSRRRKERPPRATG